MKHSIYGPERFPERGNPKRRKVRSMITATILDAEMHPISGDFQIVGDDFDLAVAAAESAGDLEISGDWMHFSVQDGGCYHASDLSPFWVAPFGESFRAVNAVFHGPSTGI
jgi:hypothetical protein